MHHRTAPEQYILNKRTHHLFHITAEHRMCCKPESIPISKPQQIRLRRRAAYSKVDAYSVNISNTPLLAATYAIVKSKGEASASSRRFPQRRTVLKSALPTDSRTCVQSSLGRAVDASMVDARRVLSMEAGEG